MSRKCHFLCSCYFSNNLFLRDYKLHTTFHSESQFLEDYEGVLKSRGCGTDLNQLQRVLQEVKDEVQRRRDGGREHVERCRRIQESYRRLHPTVYTLSRDFFELTFLSVVDYAKSDCATPEGLIEMLKEEDAPNVFSLPVFTPGFCVKLMEELENFERSDLPKGRPNTMNRGGVLLSEMGFDAFIDTLRVDYLMPLAQLLYPEQVGKGFDSHRAFVVKYAMDEDTELSYHYDNAEVTLNVCLGTNFTGGELYFGTMRKEEAAVHSQRHYYQHRAGRGLIHRGQHRHGACPIASGNRYNLIVWMRASSVRNRLCPMCDKTPVLVPNMGYGDGFTDDSHSLYCSVI